VATKRPSQQRPGARVVGMLRVETRSGKVSVAGELTGILFREGESWVAYCEGLDLSSFGATQDEALAAVQQATRLFIESCISRGTLEQALSELGWACQTPDGRLADCRTQRLPPAFMIEAVTRQGTHWSQPIRFGE
jgi:predicted RNase H-like HicB family nuclease